MNGKQSRYIFLAGLLLAGNVVVSQGNYLRTWETKAPETNPANLNTATSLQKALMTTAYFDGLGRPMQTVTRQGSLETGISPTDLVSMNVYDSRGREAMMYLPYASLTSDGNFKSNALSEQLTFMQGQFASQNESFFYGQVRFESSPASRIQETFAPGMNWSGTFSQANESDRKSLKNRYWVNTSTDDVKIWDVTSGPGINPYGLQIAINNNGDGTQTVTYTWTNPIPSAGTVLLMYRTLPSGSWVSSAGSPVSPRTFSMPVGTYEYAIQIYFNNGNPSQTVVYSSTVTTNYSVAGVYAAGQLFKNAMINENGKQVIEFKDKNGRTLLKKIQAANGIEDDGSGRNYTNWLCTYFIYDDMNNLRCIVQPRGVELLIANGWNMNAVNGDILNEQCFRYEYDARQRVISKKAPGSGEVRMVYDARDRLVMTQDANLRGVSVKKWLYILYDEFNRPIATGLMYDPDNYDKPFVHQANASSSTAYPNIASYTTEEMSKTFYDNYDWITSNAGQNFSSTRSTADDSYLVAPSSSFPYPQAITQDNAQKGAVTGTKTKVLGTFGSNIYLYAISYYDNKGKAIQVQTQNFSGGLDIVTTQYTWAGQPVMGINRTDKAGPGNQTLTILAQTTYDDLGRVSKIEKKIKSTLVNSGSMPSTWTTIVQNEYNKLGQLKRKKLGNKPNSPGTALANLDYEYNVRGWLLSVNKNYITSGTNNDQYFGMELGYEKNGSLGTFNAQFNGNIGGTIWKTEGDQQKRKYDFTYDPANRLVKSDFTQYVGGSGSTAVFNTSAGIDFSVGGNTTTGGTIKYDANGNIMEMWQTGFKLTSSEVIDKLSYTYVNNTSNKLATVTDAITGDNKLGDFTDRNTGSNDYSYDANGNMLVDKNKKIDWIDYNHLNLVQGVTIRDNNNVTNTVIYKYDASGNKIQKEVYPGAVPPGKTTLYIGGSVFEDNVLQFTSHEEGKIRALYNNAANPSSITGFAYDYFIKDHLGNVRVVLTDEQKTIYYPAATLEGTFSAPGSPQDNSMVNYEKKFYNIDPSKIKPEGTAPQWTPESGTTKQYYNHNGNPPSNLSYPVGCVPTQANESGNLYQLNAAENKTGLEFVIKVMAGDKVDIFGKSYYVNSTTITNGNSSALDLLGLMTSLLLGPASPAAAKGLNATQLNTLNTGLIPSGFFRGNNNEPSTTVPKAYINYILFDDQFKYVAGDFSRVGPNSGELKDHWYVDAQLRDIPVTKNGYLFVYVSNESNMNVFFDNLQVIHKPGPILEETHYYPFGLTMAGISSSSMAFGNPNKLKFGGKEEQKNEFSDGTGLAWQDFGARMYDMQIGRWFVKDPMADSYSGGSAYSYGVNNPVNVIDPTGAEVIEINGGWQLTGQDAIEAFQKLQMSFDRREREARRAERMYNKWMKKIGDPLNAMKSNSNFSRQQVIDEAMRLSEKYQNRKWFRFFLPSSAPGNPNRAAGPGILGLPNSYHGGGGNAGKNENYKSESTGWKMKLFIYVDPYVNSTTSQAIGSRDPRLPNTLNNNQEYTTNLMVGPGGTVSAQFFPFHIPDQLDLIAGGVVIASTGSVAFNDDPNTPVNEEASTSANVSSAPSSTRVPLPVSFQVNNNQQGDVDKWRMIITVTNPVMVVNPLQSVKATFR